jgi:hypothetical protein
VSGGAKAEPPPRTGAEGGARENVADADLASVEPTMVDLKTAHYFAVVPARSPELAQAESNAFIRCHRVLTVDRRWVELGGANKGDVLHCCGKMPSLRKAGLPGSFNLPKLSRMYFAYLGTTCYGGVHLMRSYAARHRSSKDRSRQS